MRILLITISFWLSLTCLLGQENSDVIRVVSYNIRLDHAGDNQNNWHNRKADMLNYLNDQIADFIGVQEAISHQLAYLLEGNKRYKYIGVGRDDGISGGEFSAIIYDAERWSPIESNTFWLSETPFNVSKGWDAVCHRVVTYGLFKNKENQQLLVLNTHFDHVGKEARVKSIELINEFISSFENQAIVLTGDFNFTPDDQNYKMLTSNLKDAFVQNGKDGWVGTFNGFGDDNKASRRIDYVLSQGLRMLSYQVDQPKTSKDLQLSDHYPVLVNYKIED